MRCDRDCLGPPEPGRAAALGVPARLWKVTLDDVLADIKANRTAAKQAVIHNLYCRELDEADREAKLDLLRHDAWFGQPLLRRLMRRQWHWASYICRSGVQLVGIRFGRPSAPTDARYA
jgi:hypothetical protein